MATDTPARQSFKTYLDFVKGDTMRVNIKFREIPITPNPVLKNQMLILTTQVSKHIQVKHLEHSPDTQRYYVRYIMDLRFYISIIFQFGYVDVNVADIHDMPTLPSGFSIECPQITEHLLYLIDEDQKRRDENVYKKLMSVVDEIEKEEEKPPETYDDCCLCLDNTNPISFRCNTCKEGLICKSCVKPFKKRFHTCPCCRADRHKKTG